MSTRQNIPSNETTKKDSQRNKSQTNALKTLRRMGILETDDTSPRKDSTQAVSPPTTDKKGRRKSKRERKETTDHQEDLSNAMIEEILGPDDPTSSAADDDNPTSQRIEEDGSHPPQEPTDLTQQRVTTIDDTPRRTKRRTRHKSNPHEVVSSELEAQVTMAEPSHQPRHSPVEAELLDTESTQEWQDEAAPPLNQEVVAELSDDDGYRQLYDDDPPPAGNQSIAVTNEPTAVAKMTTIRDAAQLQVSEGTSSSNDQPTFTGIIGIPPSSTALAEERRQHAAYVQRLENEIRRLKHQQQHLSGEKRHRTVNPAPPRLTPGAERTSPPAAAHPLPPASQYSLWDAQERGIQSTIDQLSNPPRKATHVPARGWGYEDSSYQDPPFAAAAPSGPPNDPPNNNNPPNNPPNGPGGGGGGGGGPPDSSSSESSSSDESTTSGPPFNGPNDPFRPPTKGPLFSSPPTKRPRTNPTTPFTTSGSQVLLTSTLGAAGKPVTRPVQLLKAELNQLRPWLDVVRAYRSQLPGEAAQQLVEGRHSWLSQTAMDDIQGLFMIWDQPITDSYAPIAPQHQALFPRLMEIIGWIQSQPPGPDKPTLGATMQRLWDDNGWGGRGWPWDLLIEVVRVTDLTINPPSTHTDQMTLPQLSQRFLLRIRLPYYSGRNLAEVTDFTKKIMHLATTSNELSAEYNPTDPTWKRVVDKLIAVSLNLSIVEDQRFQIYEFARYGNCPAVQLGYNVQMRQHQIRSVTDFARIVLQEANGLIREGRTSQYVDLPPPSTVRFMTREESDQVFIELCHATSIDPSVVLPNYRPGATTATFATNASTGATTTARYRPPTADSAPPEVTTHQPPPWKTERNSMGKGPVDPSVPTEENFRRQFFPNAFRDTCNICGNHGHMKDECPLPYHPDANPFGPWFASVAHRRWYARCGTHQLDPTWTTAGKPWGDVTMAQYDTALASGIPLQPKDHCHFPPAKNKFTKNHNLPPTERTYHHPPRYDHVAAVPPHVAPFPPAAFPPTSFPPAGGTATVQQPTYVPPAHLYQQQPPAGPTNLPPASGSGTDGQQPPQRHHHQRRHSGGGRQGSHTQGRGKSEPTLPSTPTHNILVAKHVKDTRAVVHESRLIPPIVNVLIQAHDDKALRARTLLDSGATDANYVSEAWFQAHRAGLELEAKQQRVRVRGIHEGCKISIGSFVVPITFIKSKFIVKTFRLRFHVISGLPVDMIVGYPTMYKYNLTLAYDNLFHNPAGPHDWVEPTDTSPSPCHHVGPDTTNDPTASCQPCTSERHRRDPPSSSIRHATVSTRPLGRTALLCVIEQLQRGTATRKHKPASMPNHRIIHWGGTASQLRRKTNAEIRAEHRENVTKAHEEARRQSLERELEQPQTTTDGYTHADKEEFFDVEEIPETEFIEIPGYDHDMIFPVETSTSTATGEERAIPNVNTGDHPFDIAILILLQEYESLFCTEVRPEPARLNPMELHCDMEKWKSMPQSLEPPRMLNGPKQESLQKMIRQLLRLGVIRKSQATHASQVLLVNKPDGTHRFCLDYRALNMCINSLGWPIPNIKQLLERLGAKKAKYYGVFDLTSGYHQAPLEINAQELAAFRTPIGTYAFTRVPMGLKSAPSYFQQKMAQTVLRGYIHNICEVYLDDVIVFGATQDEFLKNTRTVLECLRKHNVTINPKKCTLGLQRIEYVGHVIDHNGISMSDKKIRKVLDFEQPKTLKQLQAFVGLANYFRDHIEKHSDTVQPLTELIAKIQKQRRFEWDPAIHGKAFQQMKTAIEQCPKLFFMTDHPNYDIYLQTDASDYGCGACLFQRQRYGDRTSTPIRFLSHSFSREQRRWSTADKEAYAIYYALQEWDYLLRDVHFTIQTDHKNLQYLKAAPSAKITRWKMAIQEFDFDLEYIPGPVNEVADALSRLVPPTPMAQGNQTEQSTAATEQLCATAFLDNDADAENVNYIIPADKLRILAEVHNSRVGHLGVLKTKGRLQRLGIKWQHMWSHIKKFIRNCDMCQRMAPFKPILHAKAFTVTTYQPMTRISLDTIGPLNKSAEGYEYILVIIDNFSRFCELYPLISVGAEEATRCLFDFFNRYGIADEVLTDKGTQFANDMFTNLVRFYDSKPLLTITASKQENSIVERRNKEVIRYLSALIFDSRVVTDWAFFLRMAQRMCNSVVHSEMGVSPAELLYGCSIDLHKGLLPSERRDYARNQNERDFDEDAEPQSESTRAFLDRILATQQAMYDRSKRFLEELADKRRAAQEKDTPADSIPIGALVLAEDHTVRRVTQAIDGVVGSRKFNPYWTGPYRVTRKLDDQYEVYHLATNKQRTFHVTKLKRYFYDPLYCDPENAAAKDSGEFIISQVVNHRGNFNNLKSLTFQVQFKGEELKDEPTNWLEWKDIRRSTALRAYMMLKPELHKYLRKLPRLESRHEEDPQAPAAPASEADPTDEPQDEATVHVIPQLTPTTKRGRRRYSTQQRREDTQPSPTATPRNGVIPANEPRRRGRPPRKTSQSAPVVPTQPARNEGSAYKKRKQQEVAAKSNGNIEVPSTISRTSKRQCFQRQIYQA